MSILKRGAEVCPECTKITYYKREHFLWGNMTLRHFDAGSASTKVTKH